MENVRILMFKLNLEEETYDDIEINQENPINEQLKSKDIIFIVDGEHSRIWIWEGTDANIKMKFLSTQIASKIRDRHGITYTITCVDEGSEPAELKELLY